MTGPSKIASIHTGNDLDYPHDQALYEELLKTVYKYEGKVSTAAAIGCLEIVKDQMMGNAR